MTQRHIPHAEGLPRCHAGHVARHIHDQRCTRAGGGHSIECQCRSTPRFADFGLAMDQWCRDNQRPIPVQQALPLAASGWGPNVIRLGGN